MSGNSWRGDQDPAKSRAKAFEDVQVGAAEVEKQSVRLAKAKDEARRAEIDLRGAEDVYRKAKAELEELMPAVREPLESYPA